MFQEENRLNERFEFRNIYSEEADQAVRIEQICFPPNEACTEKMMCDRVTVAPELFLVAVDKATGKIAGFLNGLATDENVFRDEFFSDIRLYNPDGAYVMLLGLDVLPEYRGQGLAREIMRQYCQMERRKGRKQLILTCLDSKVEMYEKMGYQDLGIADSSWGGEQWHEMRYELNGMDAKIKAVLFDMDGVLIDTERYLTKFWQQAAREAGLDLDITEFYEFRSLASRFASVEFQKKYGSQYDYFAIRERRKELMNAHLAEHGIEMKPEVKETLQVLKERGYYIAVVTATDEERTKQYLTEIGIYDWFDSIICATMVERGKPFPDVYLYACERIGCRPEECMAVEDSPNGVAAASAAGCRTVMVPDLTLPDSELEKKVIGVRESLSGILTLLN
jgi:HAD superfamily hydrolase (TIGR01509 family)